MAMPRSELARPFYRCAYMRGTEANLLRRAGQPTGAVYLGGYVAEFMLKALILESQPAEVQHQVMEELKKTGHNLTRLLEFYRAKGGSRPSAPVAKQFNYVNAEWSSDIRYDPRHIKASIADKFLEAVRDFSGWADGRI